MKENMETVIMENILSHFHMNGDEFIRWAEWWGDGKEVIGLETWGEAS